MPCAESMFSPLCMQPFLAHVTQSQLWNWAAVRATLGRRADGLHSRVRELALDSQD
jgi:hypothetical protein